MKKIKLVLFGFFIFMCLGFIKVDALTITGNSVYRKNATTADINFISNTSGTAYYIINESSTANLQDIMSGTNAGEVIEATTKKIPILNLTSGKKYIHIIVKNENSLSNVLTIPMPYDVYYFDDFESYDINSYPDFFTIKYDGSEASMQKIINLNNNKVFNAYGTYSKGLDERINLEELSSGYAVYEADVSATTLTDSYYFGGLVIGPDDSDKRNVMIQVHPRNKVFVSGETAGNHTSNISFIANKNYHVKMILDVQNKKLDYYINDIKANEQPISITQNYYTSLKWFGIYNGSGNTQFDNMKFYVRSTEPNIHFITKDTETNGTFTINTSSAEVGDIITVIPTPNEGYRVKSVKVNDSEIGITNDTTNYKFIMPNENAIVLVEFEKIPYTISINSGIGFTVDKTSPITVNSGSNQEIKIKSDLGYRLISVKVNGVEKLPLINDTLALTNITDNKTVEVTVEKIKYEVTNGNGQKYIIGKEEDVVFRIDADKNLFNKVYLNAEELNSNFYTITEGSTIITLKKDYLNNLLPSTYNLRATFTDGGEATTTFVIEKEEPNPQTEDSIIFSLILGSISLIGLLGTSIYLNKKVLIKLKK